MEKARKPQAKAARPTPADRFIGRSRDGIEIARPVVKPRSFTVQQLRRVMRDVLREEAVGRAG
jgi:hypothetical protein